MEGKTGNAHRREETMNQYFFSLHILITGRMREQPTWSVLDELAEQIADETQPIRPLLKKFPAIFNIDALKPIEEL